jgi:hypothetical protein
MRRIILTALVLLLVLSGYTYAFEKGTKSIGGLFSLSRAKYENSPAAYSLVVLPDLSYFLWDNFVIDLSPGISLDWSKDDDTSLYFRIGFGARYFYKKYYAGFSFVLDGTSYAGNKKTTQGLQLRFGRLFGIAKNVYLNTELDYNIDLNGNSDTCSGGSCGNNYSLIEFRAGVTFFLK